MISKQQRFVLTTCGIIHTASYWAPLNARAFGKLCTIFSISHTKSLPIRQDTILAPCFRNFFSISGSKVNVPSIKMSVVSTTSSTSQISMFIKSKRILSDMVALSLRQYTKYTLSTPSICSRHCFKNAIFWPAPLDQIWLYDAPQKKVIPMLIVTPPYHLPLKYIYTLQYTYRIHILRIIPKQYILLSLSSPIHVFNIFDITL